jgi:MHS family proline/betaine transporter-like MFS transporter
MIKRTKTLLSSIVGTSLEFYDFMLYAVFLEVIGQEFFPSTSGTSSQSFGYIGFLAAFIMRPFGASIFGYIGDRWGRRIALVLSISLMGIPTLIIGILPSYASWGVAASIILVLCRLFQGLCTGGEYNGSAIFALEHVGKRYPGFTGGLITGASIIGALIATSVGLLLRQPGMPAWGWRAAFCAGAVVSLGGLYIRLSIPESPEFQKFLKEHKVKKNPLFSAFTRNWLSSITTISIGLLNGVLSYTLYKFLDVYLYDYLHLPKTESLWFSWVGIAVYMIAAPFMGFVLDKVGRKQMMLGSCVMVFLLAVPIYFLLQIPTLWIMVVAQIVLSLCVASIAGPQHAFVQSIFPVEDRYSGISFNYSIGIAMGGGMGPALMKLGIDHYNNLYVPAFFLMGTSVVCFTLIYLRSRKGPIYA